MTDERSTHPGPLHRRNFHWGWKDAVNGRTYDPETCLNALTWHNLGWRLGKVLGPASPEMVDSFFEVCVAQQAGRLVSC